MIIPLSDMITEYNLRITGCLHIGAHDGGEIQKYSACGIPHCILFEPQIHHFTNCLNASSSTNYEVHRLALGSHEGNITMYCEPGGQSSSCLLPTKHTVQYPEIVFNKREDVTMTTLDTFMRERQDKLHYNFINIDVQGYELEVFKGATETLDHVDYIYSEVNRLDLYEGCVLVEELDEFLLKYNFKRVLTDWAGLPNPATQPELGTEGTWGDALYVKETIDVGI